MLFKITLLVLAVLSGAATAYNDNCDGSFFQTPAEQCVKAIQLVDPEAIYIDDFRSPYKHCYLGYHTNGSGDQPIDGLTIIETALEILAECNTHGSFGTGNCEECYGSLNHRGYVEGLGWD